MQEPPPRTKTASTGVGWTLRSSPTDVSSAPLAARFPAGRVRRAGGGGGAGAEPVGDAGHVGLEVAGDGDVEDAGAFSRAVLEVVRRAGGGDHQGAFLGVDPLGADEEAHRAFEDEEDV